MGLDQTLMWTHRKEGKVEANKIQTQSKKNSFPLWSTTGVQK